VWEIGHSSGGGGIPPILLVIRALVNTSSYTSVTKLTRPVKLNINHNINRHPECQSQCRESTEAKRIKDITHRTKKDSIQYKAAVYTVAENNCIIIISLLKITLLLPPL